MRDIVLAFLAGLLIGFGVTLRLDEDRLKTRIEFDTQYCVTTTAIAVDTAVKHQRSICGRGLR